MRDTAASLGVPLPDAIDSRVIVWPLSGLFITLGVGAVLGGYLSPRGLAWWHLQFVVSTACGVIAILASTMLRRRAQRSDALQ